MKLSCDVIRDLLPLYADRAASADTAALVEEHLASCPACREELGRLGAALPAEPEGAEPLRRFKRRWRRRQVLIAVTAVVATAAVAAGIFLTCFWGRRVAAGEVEVRMRVAATDPVTWETRPATALGDQTGDGGGLCPGCVPVCGPVPAGERGPAAGQNRAICGDR